MYHCSECNAPVVVAEDGTITRSCEHEDAPVIAEAAATMAGSGGLS